MSDTCPDCGDGGWLFIEAECLATDDDAPIAGWVDVAYRDRCHCTLGRAQETA